MTDSSGFSGFRPNRETSSTRFPSGREKTPTKNGRNRGSSSSGVSEKITIVFENEGRNETETETENARKESNGSNGGKTDFVPTAVANGNGNADGNGHGNGHGNRTVYRIEPRIPFAKNTAGSTQDSIEPYSSDAEGRPSDTMEPEIANGIENEATETITTENVPEDQYPLQTQEDAVSADTRSNVKIVKKKTTAKKPKRRQPSQPQPQPQPRPSQRKKGPGITQRSGLVLSIPRIAKAAGLQLGKENTLSVEAKILIAAQMEKLMQVVMENAERNKEINDPKRKSIVLEDIAVALKDPIFSAFTANLILPIEESDVVNLPPTKKAIKEAKKAKREAANSKKRKRSSSRGAIEDAETEASSVTAKGRSNETAVRAPRKKKVTAKKTTAKKAALTKNKSKAGAKKRIAVSKQRKRGNESEESECEDENESKSESEEERPRKRKK